MVLVAEADLSLSKRNRLSKSKVLNGMVSFGATAWGRPEAAAQFAYTNLGGGGVAMHESSWYTSIEMVSAFARRFSDGSGKRSCMQYHSF